MHKGCSWKLSRCLVGKIQTNIEFHTGPKFLIQRFFKRLQRRHGSISFLLKDCSKVVSWWIKAVGHKDVPSKWRYFFVVLWSWNPTLREQSESASRAFFVWITNLQQWKKTCFFSWKSLIKPQSYSIPGSAQRQLGWKNSRRFQWKNHLWVICHCTFYRRESSNYRVFPQKTFMALSENGVYSQLYSHWVGETMIKNGFRGTKKMRTKPEKNDGSTVRCPQKQKKTGFHAATFHLIPSGGCSRFLGRTYHIFTYGCGSKPPPVNLKVDGHPWKTTWFVGFDPYPYLTIWVCLKNSVPLNPMVNDHYPY